MELMISVVIGGMLLLGFQRLLSVSLSAKEGLSDEIRLVQQARFAMTRMTKAVAGSPRLVLPLADDVDTNWPENIREQSDPPTPPIGDSSLATAVLAVTLPIHWDANKDGIADADNDGDGRIDEDWGYDNNNDGDDGIRGIDDDGDGSVDENFFGTSDDEDAEYDEDRIDGLDTDRDGSVEEDTGRDMNGDYAPGLAGVDDDGDGSIDEGDYGDDDEDDLGDEDWQDSLVFYLQGTNLIERRAVPWDTSGDSNVTGIDYVESVIAEGVTYLRFERIATTANQKTHVSIQFTLDDGEGNSTEMATTVRLGGEVLGLP